MNYWGVLLFLHLHTWSTDLGAIREPFIGYQTLKECQEIIPVSYSSTKEEAFLATATNLEGIKLVLVTVNKNAKPTYRYLYLVRDEVHYKPTAFFVPANEIDDNEGRRTGIFIEYLKKKHFFFRADCFDNILKEQPEISRELKRVS